MMKRFVIPVSLAISFTMLFVSCEKPAGEGGTATVNGTVWVKNYNSTFTQLTGEYAAADEDVYIVYGDHVGYDDKTSTDYNGSFSFRYLRPGNYTVYVYSKDSTLTSVSGEIAVIQQFQVTQRGQVVDLPRFTIFD